MDEMIKQIGHFKNEEKEADFVKISECLRHYGISPKFCMRYWDSMRKKLREHYRKNEFISVCRNEVQEDFCTEASSSFKNRMAKYEHTLTKQTSSCNLKRYSYHE